MDPRIEKIKISVVMSIYKPNRTHLIKAINSILNQTFPYFEFIIIIDDVNPNIYKLLNEYEDERIVIIQNQKNIGLTKSLNKGIKRAKGKYIARMDADDVSFPERLKEQYKFMEKNPDVSVVGSYAKNIGDKGVPKQHWTPNQDKLRIRMLFYNAGIIHPTAFIRKRFLKEYKLKYNESILKAQDYALWVEVLKHGKIKVLSKILLGYRRHEGQITSSVDEVSYYANLTKVQQWKEIGFSLRDTDIIVLNTISSRNIKIEKRYFLSFFNRIIAWNNKNRKFNERYLKAEISRIWLHTALKKLKYNRNFDMLLDLFSLNITKPYNIWYSVKFYLLENLHLYFKYYTSK